MFKLNWFKCTALTNEPEATPCNSNLYKNPGYRTTATAWVTRWREATQLLASVYLRTVIGNRLTHSCSLCNQVLNFLFLMARDSNLVQQAATHQSWTISGQSLPLCRRRGGYMIGRMGTADAHRCVRTRSCGACSERPRAEEPTN